MFSSPREFPSLKENSPIVRPTQYEQANELTPLGHKTSTPVNTPKTRRAFTEKPETFGASVNAPGVTDSAVDGTLGCPKFPRI